MSDMNDTFGSTTYLCNLMCTKASADYNRFFTQWEHYKDCLAFAHILEKLDIKDNFYAWCNKNVDFLHESVQPQKVITMAHQLVLLFANHLRKFYCKRTQGIVILEALKFCVPPLVALESTCWVLVVGAQDCHFDYGSKQISKCNGIAFSGCIFGPSDFLDSKF